MIGRVLGATMAVALLTGSVGFAQYDRACCTSTVTPTAVYAAVSHLKAAASDNMSDGTTRAAVTGSRPVLSLADLIGIILFFALIGAHFFMCRKGMYPESSCLCEPPPWLRRLFTRASRRAHS
jgi:hypothetical protein